MLKSGPLRLTPFETRECPSWTALATASPFFVVAPGQGQVPLVTVYDAVTGQDKFDFYAYGSSFLGGVRVAVGDVNRDGVPDIVTAPGPGGGPHVRAFSGIDGRPLLDFFAFEPGFQGGVTVAAGDVTGDGRDEIVVGAGNGGGPRVRVFDTQSHQVKWDFFAYESSFRGGVFVGIGHFGGTVGRGIVTGAGVGGGPVVKVFDYVKRESTAAFFAYPSATRGGVLLATGDLDGDGFDDIVTGPGRGSPEVKVFDPNGEKEKLSFVAGSSSDTGGIRVGVIPGAGTIPAFILTGSGPGDPAAIRLFTRLNGDVGQTQTPGDATNRVGYFVAG